MAEAYKVVFNHLPRLAKVMHEVVADVVARTAKEIAGEVAINAPEQTDFLKSSVYTVTWTESTYGQGIVPGNTGSYLLPEVAKPINDLIAIVAVAANYGVFVEYGTSRMAAHPYFYPAVLAGQSFFTQWMKDLEKEMRKRAKVA